VWRRRLPSAVVPLLSILAAALAVAAFAGEAEARTSRASTVFVLTGGGWGHGVGMSQWGAFGQAEAGRSYEQILSTYYPGTTLTRAPRYVVRVALSGAVPRAAVSADGPFVVSDASGRRHRVAGGALALTSKLRARVGPHRSRIALHPPVVIRALAGTRLSYDGAGIRGELRIVRSPGKTVVVVDDLNLEDYVAGVVPHEMPAGWPLPALEAQAVAARTFAVAGLGASRNRQWDFDADSPAQTYAGLAREQQSTSKAVRDTAGQILTYHGATAQTLYFSSSGGRTMSSLDVFGYAAPYLQSVPDPWDAASPNHAWQPRLLTPQTLARALGLRAPVDDVTVLPGVAATSSRSPERLRFTLASGGEQDLDLQEIRSRMNLLSTDFSFGELTLDHATETATAGSPIVLTGVARDVPTADIEQRLAGDRWVRVGEVKPDATGSFSFEVRPTKTRVYRLAASGVTGPPVLVRVADEARRGRTTIRGRPRTDF
jgi:SpoIID/LytB domain protein